MKFNACSTTKNSEDKIRNSVRQIMSHKSATAIVAFVGDDVDEVIGNCKRIYCDFWSNGTSYAGAKSLFDSDIEVFHIKNLHAKIYYSPNGVFVGSANLSKNGMAMGKNNNLLEAGVLLNQSDGEQFKILRSEIDSWLEEVHLKNKIIKIKPSDLKRKKQIWRPIYSPQYSENGDLEIIDSIRENPGHYLIAAVFGKTDLKGHEPFDVEKDTEYSRIDTAAAKTGSSISYDSLKENEIISYGLDEREEKLFPIMKPYQNRVFVAADLKIIEDGDKEHCEISRKKSVDLYRCPGLLKYKGSPDGYSFMVLLKEPTDMQDRVANQTEFLGLVRDIFNNKANYELVSPTQEELVLFEEQYLTGEQFIKIIDKNSKS